MQAEESITVHSGHAPEPKLAWDERAGRSLKQAKKMPQVTFRLTA